MSYQTARLLEKQQRGYNRKFNSLSRKEQLKCILLGVNDNILIGFYEKQCTEKENIKYIEEILHNDHSKINWAVILQFQKRSYSFFKKYEDSLIEFIESGQFEISCDLKVYRNNQIKAKKMLCS